MFEQLKWGRAGWEQPLPAAGPSGLPRVCRSPVDISLSVIRGYLAQSEYRVTMVRGGTGLPPLPPLWPPLPSDCHAEPGWAAVRLSALICCPCPALSAEGWLLIDRLRGRAGTVFSSKMFPHAAAAIRAAFTSSQPCRRCLAHFSLPFWTPRELVSGLVTAVLGAPTNTSMSYLSISRWGGGHGRSKYLSLLFCPVCLKAGVRVFIVQLQGKLPVSPGISHQNHWPSPAFREGFNHIKSSGPSIRLVCCHKIAAGGVKADSAATVLAWGPGILTLGTARSRSFPIPNGDIAIPPSQRRVPL